jgi:hypothetical protein
MTSMFDNWFSPDAWAKEQERRKQREAQGIVSASDIKVQREIALQTELMSNPTSIAKIWAEDDVLSKEDAEQYAREFKECMARPIETKAISPGMPGYVQQKRLQEALDTHATIKRFLEISRGY